MTTARSISLSISGNSMTTPIGGRIGRRCTPTRISSRVWREIPPAANDPGAEAPPGSAVGSASVEAFPKSGKVPDTHSVGAICDHNLGVFTVTETSTVSCGRWCRVSAPRAEWSTRPSACAINGGFLDFGCITHRGKWPRMPDPSSRPGCRQSARVGRQSYLSHAIPWNILEWLVGIAGPFPRHLQHPFADDVPLDLISTASDRGSRYRH